MGKGVWPESEQYWWNRHPAWAGLLALAGILVIYVFAMVAWWLVGIALLVGFGWWFMRAGSPRT